MRRDLLVGKPTTIDDVDATIVAVGFDRLPGIEGS